MIVFDDFLSDFEARRTHALSGGFKPVEAPNGGLFPGINADAINDFPFSKVLTFYRLTLEGDELPTFIHNDCAMATKTGILYLGEGTGGTAFWRHVSGSYGAHDMNLPIETYQRDGLLKERWHLETTVDWKPNRLVLFESGLWHSPHPRHGWGRSPDSGRLIQVYFFQ